MSLLIKTIGNKKYAYLAYRAGNKVIHKYLGPMTKRAVTQKIKAMEKEKQIPKKYYPLFWDTYPGKVNLKTEKRYVIERILEMGSLDAFEWLQRIYPTNLIIETCEASRRLSEKSRIFWEIWIGVQNA